MSGAVSDHLQSATNLRRSLEDAADALTRADLPHLLACEARIHAALTDLSTSALSPDARARLADEIALARRALHRCRRLGSALIDFARIGLAAQGLDDGYGRTGTSVNPDLQTLRRSA